MKHSGSLLEPVPAGGVLGQAMAIKLTADLVAKLLGRPKITIKLGPSEKTLVIGTEQFSLAEVREETGSHDLYQSDGESFVRVAAIGSRLNMQRTLNQQVADELKGKTQQAEMEYRGKKIGSVEEAAAVPLNGPSGPLTRKRGAPAAATKAKPVAKAAPAKPTHTVPPKEVVRRQLVHVLAASDKGLTTVVLEKSMNLPLRDFKFILSLISSQDKDLYKLNTSSYKEVDSNYDGYTPAERAVALQHKQRILAEQAAKAKAAIPPPSSSSSSSSSSCSSSSSSSSSSSTPSSTPPSEPAIKRRKQAHTNTTTTANNTNNNNTHTHPHPALESLQLAKPVACPEDVSLNGLKYSEKYATSLYPEIKSVEEYERYRADFHPKHERYKELDQKLVANSKEFTDLARQFEKCTDRNEKKKLKDLILKRIAQKKQSHQKMVAEWKQLHVELSEIKDRVGGYVQKFQDTLS